MTKDFENMLYLFGANATGRQISDLEQLNIEAIRKYSLEQGIWTMVYPELSKLCDASKYRQEFFSSVSKGITKKEFTLGIIKKLEEENIKCCLLKGAAISGLYADSECRISGDADILINPKDEKKLKKVLLENGYSIEKREKNDHHLKAYHQVGGLLEAHISLYSKRTEKILFNGLKMYNEPWDTMEISGKSFNILGVNDGLIYLTAHYIKHLVNSGGGVRQMMDLLLYIEAYKDKIDFLRYEKLLAELKYEKVVKVIKSVGAKYFGFDYEIKEVALMNKILEDTEEGGIFGFSVNTRARFYEAYCRKRTTMSRAIYKIFEFTQDERSVFERIFPKQETLVHYYGYEYAKNKWLMPFAIINCYFDRIFKRRKKKNEGGIACNAEFNDRMKMMQDLGMIK